MSDDGAMPEGPRADAGDHVAVVAALGRLGMLGGWDRVRAGEALKGLDRADAALLLAAGILERSGADQYTVIDEDLSDLDGATVGHAMVAQLRNCAARLSTLSARLPGGAAPIPRSS